MASFQFLNAREAKEVKAAVAEQWGRCPDLDFVFAKNNQDKVFLMNRSIVDQDVSAFRINNIGMFFCKLDKIGIRLSIEGSQLVGPVATKNVVEISTDQMKQWLMGDDIPLEISGSGFAIVKSGSDFCGCGKYSQAKILNYVSKSRRTGAIV